MGKPNNCLEWRQYPENIRHVRDRHKARAMRDGVSESGGIEIAECVRIDPAQDDATPFPKHMPRHQIGVMIERSEEHTSELQSLMRISYAVFCLKKKKKNKQK